MSARSSLVVAALCSGFVYSLAWGSVTSTQALEKRLAKLGELVKAMEEMRAKGTVQDAAVCKKYLEEHAKIKQGLDAEAASIKQDEQNALSKDDINWVITMNARKDELAKALKLYEAAGLAKRIAHLCEPDPPKTPPKKGNVNLAPNSPSTR